MSMTINSNPRLHGSQKTFVQFEIGSTSKKLCNRTTEVNIVAPQSKKL